MVLILFEIITATHYEPVTMLDNFNLLSPHRNNQPRGKKDIRAGNFNVKAKE